MLKIDSALLVFRKNCPHNYGEDSPIRKGCRFSVKSADVPVNIVSINEERSPNIGMAKVYRDDDGNVYATFRIDKSYKCLLSKLVVMGVYPAVCINYDTSVILPRSATISAIAIVSNNVDSEIPKLDSKYISYEEITDD